jgi:hypothetical protein
MSQIQQVSLKWAKNSSFRSTEGFSTKDLAAALAAEAPSRLRLSLNTY